MTADSKNLNNEIGGTSNNVSPIDPVFSYHVEGGDIYVYLVKTEIARIAIATFDNTDNEYAFAIQTLTSNSEFEAVELIRNAEKAYNNFEGENPFSELYDNQEAMEKLAGILASFFESGA
jgi:hypothetical protein